MIEYTYDNDLLDLANLQTESIIGMELLEIGQESLSALALFCADGTVLVLAKDTNFKVKTVFKLLPLHGDFDNDSTTFTKVSKLSHRLSIFLMISVEGSLIY